MTVGELVAAAPFCNAVEVVVRENGTGEWIQGYRISKYEEMYKCEFTVEFQEAILKDGTKHKYGIHVNGNNQTKMTQGEIRDVYHGCKLPMKIIKKPVEKMPDNVAQLQVSYFQPRHIPSFHGEQATHNDFELDICAYPEGWKPEKPDKSKIEQEQQLPGQTDIFDFL